MQFTRRAAHTASSEGFAKSASASGHVHSPLRPGARQRSSWSRPRPPRISRPFGRSLHRRSSLPCVLRIRDRQARILFHLRDQTRGLVARYLISSHIKYSKSNGIQPGGLSLLQLQKELGGSTSRRTLSRRISALLRAGRIHRRGDARSTRYVHGGASAPAPHTAEQARGADHTIVAPAGNIEIAGQKPETAGQFETPEGVVTLELAPVARGILAYVNRPPAARTPRGYERRFLDDYVPNKTAYIPDKTRVHLHTIGNRSLPTEQPARSRVTSSVVFSSISPGHRAGSRATRTVGLIPSG